MKPQFLRQITVLSISSAFVGCAVEAPRENDETDTRPESASDELRRSAVVGHFEFQNGSDSESAAFHTLDISADGRYVYRGSAVYLERRHEVIESGTWRVQLFGRGISLVRASEVTQELERPGMIWRRYGIPYLEPLRLGNAALFPQGTGLVVRGTGPAAPGDIPGRVQNGDSFLRGGTVTVMRDAVNARASARGNALVAARSGIYDRRYERRSADGLTIREQGVETLTLTGLTYLYESRRRVRLSAEATVVCNNNPVEQTDFGVRCFGFNDELVVRTRGGLRYASPFTEQVLVHDERGLTSSGADLDRTLFSAPWEYVYWQAGPRLIDEAQVLYKGGYRYEDFSPVHQSRDDHTFEASGTTLVVRGDRYQPSFRQVFVRR